MSCTAVVPQGKRETDSAVRPGWLWGFQVEMFPARLKLPGEIFFGLRKRLSHEEFLAAHGLRHIVHSIHRGHAPGLYCRGKGTKRWKLSPTDADYCVEAPTLILPGKTLWISPDEPKEHRRGDCWTTDGSAKRDSDWCSVWGLGELVRPALKSWAGSWKTPG